MVREIINVGAAEDDGTGEPLRDAWIKVNNMTSEIYTTFGDGSTLSSAGGTVPVEDDGSEIVAAPTALNFTGSGVTVSDNGGVADININSGAASNIDDLSDVAINSGTLSDGDIGRAIGLVSRGPDTFGLLPPLTSVPVSGGVDILASNDFSANNGTDLVASNTHLYDEIYIVGYDLSDGVVDLFFRPDGVNPSVWDIERIRLSTSGNTTVDEDWGTDRFWMGIGGSNHSFRAIIKGTKAGIPLMIERLFGTRSNGDFNYSTGIAKTLEECRAIALTFQATITTGVVYIVGVKNSAQPLIVPVDYTGSPGSAGTLARFVLPLDAQLRSGASGNFRVDSNPSSEVVLNIDHEGSDIGTITIATNGDCTVSISSDSDLSAGDLLIIESTQAEDFTDLFGSLLLEGRE
jgi:hypothetical protein